VDVADDDAQRSVSRRIFRSWPDEEAKEGAKTLKNGG